MPGCATRQRSRTSIIVPLAASNARCSLDDWGLEPLGPEQRYDMLEIVEDRYGRGATLITSQIPVDRWHDLIGEPTLADAILDRIIHNAHRLQLSGDSLRKQKAPKTVAA